MTPVETFHRAGPSDKPLTDVFSLTLNRRGLLLGPRRSCVPSGSFRLNVPRVNFSPYPPVRKDRCSRDHHNLYPYRRVGVSFSGTHHLRSDHYHYHAPQHHLDNLCPDLGKPAGDPPTSRFSQNSSPSPSAGSASCSRLSTRQG